MAQTKPRVETLDRAIAVDDRRDRIDRALGVAMVAATEMQWGKDDCALWCANVLREALGYDPAAKLRGRYRTRMGARRVLGRAGLAGALRSTARRHGWRRVAIGNEQVGDIGLLLLGDVPVTVICRAPGWFVARNAHGWSALPSRMVRIIWAVV